MREEEVTGRKLPTTGVDNRVVEVSFALVVVSKALAPLPVSALLSSVTESSVFCSWPATDPLWCQRSFPCTHRGQPRFAVWLWPC